MPESRCIIIGASHAGVSLALQLRKEGWIGAITLIGAEPELPYHRPPLSKDFLAGEKTLEAISLRPEKLYRDNTIELVLGKRVARLEPEAHRVTLDTGEELSYTKLALCTGSFVRRLPAAEGYNNVFYIRTAADVLQLGKLIGAGKRAVIIGAGYIGLEAAAALVKQQVAVTVLELADRVLQRVTGAEMSAYLETLHRHHGVTIHTATGVRGFTGSGDIDSVVCEDGRSYAADFVIIGIGILPQTELAMAAGLHVEQGIVVDAGARTSDPDIYAAGDCTVHPSAVYGRNLRLESVQNATDQARVAAANICGKETVYDAVPWFWSDQYSIKLQTVGLSQDYDNLVIRGDTETLENNGFALFYRRGIELLAVDCVNRPKEFMVSKQLLKTGRRVDAGLLADESVEPASWLK